MREPRDEGMDDDVDGTKPPMTAPRRPVRADEVMRLGGVIFAVYLVFILAVLAAAFMIGVMAH